MSKARGFFTGIITLTFILEIIYLYYFIPLASNLAWFLIPVFLAGLFVADVLTGLLHWYGDTWGDTSWPVIGHFFFNFRNHHLDEKDICSHDFVHVSSGSFIVGPLFMPFSLYYVHSKPLFSFFFFVMTVGITLTNLIHRWSHQDKVPVIVRVLQKSRLILSSKHHHIHHTKPHTTYYGITNGWSNWIFEKMRFYRFLEWIGKVVFRSKPRAYEM